MDQRNVSNALEDVAGAEKPYAASRPTYGKGQAEQVWKNVKDPVTGKVYALSGVEITKDPTKPGKYLCRDVDGLVHELTEEEVESIENWINGYPRKIHGYHSAGELFEEEVKQLA